MDNSTVLQNCLLSNFYNLITVRLDDSNYVLWKFLVETMFSGCGLIRYIDGSFPRPPQYIVIEEGGVTSDMTKEYMDWVQNDSAVMSILAATLSSDALSFIVGSKTSREIWCRLKKRYVDDSVYNIMNLKASLYSIQKGSDSIDKYLLRVKSICDQLAMMEVYMADEDIVDSVLHGLPSEFATIKTIIRIKALSSSVSTEELRSLLLIAESEIEQTMKSMLERFKTEMMAHGDSFSRYAPAPTYVTDAKYDGGIQYNFGAFDYGITQQNGITQQRHNFRQNGGLMQQNGFPHQNGNFSPHVSYTNSDNYSQQSYSDNNGKNNNSRSHISNNKSYNTNQSYSSSVVCQSCEKPGTFMQQNVNCVGMQVLYGGSQVQGYSQISVTREDDNGSDSQSETNIENTQNFSQDEYVSTSEEKQEEVVSKEDSKEKVDSESENGDEGNQLEKFVEESSDEKDSLPFELCLPDEDNFITVVEYKDMVERNQVKADGVSLSAAVDSSSKPMDTKIGIKDANFSQVHKSEAINVFSDESSSSSLSNDMYMPHNANDVRWEAIQAVRDHDRMLGLNQFKLLNRHLMNCRQACESTNLWQSLLSFLLAENTFSAAI